MTGRTPGPDSPPPWRRIDVPGTPTIAAERTGIGPTPVVAIHGLGTQRRCFNALARNVRHRGGVLAVDLRGRGETPGTPGHAGLDTHVDDIIRVLDAAGVKRTILVGHSYGAYVALQVALRHPDRVAGIVLVDGGWPSPRPIDWFTPGAWLDAARAAMFMTSAGKRMQRSVSGIAEQARWWAGVSGEPRDQPSADTLDMATHDVERTTSGKWVLRSDQLAVAADVSMLPLQAPSERDLGSITCPVVVVRAGAGASQTSPPLVGPRQLGALQRSLNVRDVELPHATHYSIILGKNAIELGRVVDGLAREVLRGTSRPPVDGVA